MKHHPWYIWVIVILGPSIVFILAVLIRWQILEYRQRRRYRYARKMAATGPPVIQNPPTKKLSELNRRQRRSLLKISKKDKQSLSSKLANEKGQILDAKDFLKKYGIDKKFFDGK